MFTLHVKVDTIEAICRDGRSVTMSYESQQLRDFILCQVGSKRHSSNVDVNKSVSTSRIVTSSTSECVKFYLILCHMIQIVVV